MRSTGVPGGEALDCVVQPGIPASIEVSDVDSVADAVAWLVEARPALLAALHEYGAVYLRGLPIASVEDFARVRDVLVPNRTPYREKATPRSDFGSGVYSSTDLPASQAIRLHNENSYTLTFPGILVFGCLVAPADGGATPVADCRKILRALPTTIVAKMRSTGWLLNRSYSEHLSTDWRTAFAADSTAEVELYCAENLIACRWQPDGHLRTTQLRPGIISHPVTSDEVWFNHLTFWNQWALDEEIRDLLIDEFGPDDLPFNTAFGDGEPLTKAELAIIEDTFATATVRQRWQPGDLLVVDNILCAHGRDPFRGERRIVVSMGEPVRLADCQPTVRAAPGPRAEGTG